MMWSKLAITWMVLFMPLTGPTVAWAQGASPPPTPSESTIVAASPSPEQQQQIDNYAAYWVAKLVDPDPAVTVEARNKLIDPVRAGRSSTPSDAFRFTYSKSLVSRLAPVVGGPNSLAAINALQVAGFLGTDPALRLAMTHADVGREKRAEVRIWAAKALMLAVTSGLRSNTVASAVDDLRRAGESEPHWTALNSQLTTLKDLDALAAKDQELPQNVVEARVAVIGAALNAMSRSDGSADLMAAVYPAIHELHNNYLDLISSQRQDQSKSLGRKLAPRLAVMFKVAQTHWEKLQKDPKARQLFRRAIDVTERFLKRIDATLRTNATPPAPADSLKAWDAQDRSGFEAAGTEWTSILSKPPYGQP